MGYDWRADMEYKVASSWFCYSASHKARKIEAYLNEMARDGWRFVTLDAVTVLGFDIGFYLVVGRELRP
jgi:hypothetical protein